MECVSKGPATRKKGMEDPKMKNRQKEEETIILFTGRSLTGSPVFRSEGFYDF